MILLPVRRDNQQIAAASTHQNAGCTKGSSREDEGLRNIWNNPGRSALAHFPGNDGAEAQLPEHYSPWTKGSLSALFLLPKLNMSNMQIHFRY